MRISKNTPSMVAAAATLLLALSYLAVPVLGQTRPLVVDLDELAREFSRRWEEGRTPRYWELILDPGPAERLVADLADIQLVGTGRRGHPLFYATHNLDAAVTSRTTEVWTGGASGYDLDGAGTSLPELALWDGGLVRTTHQELAGRVVNVGPWSIGSHATHVAGTLVAAGIDQQAKGMAHQAHAKSFHWYQDTVEMATEAADGLLISNHSYGFITGWQEYTGDVWAWHGDMTLGTHEDHRFGFYGEVTAEWDQIAYAAPYYLIVKSAGNNRNDTGPAPGAEHYHYIDGVSVLDTDYHEPDGYPFGFDTIGMIACAKNILTVGAVEAIPGGYTQPSDVVQTAYSGWGPADDGRIKPDIVACGHEVYSLDSDSDTGYRTRSGTSMAAPTVAGSINLLKDLYRSTHGILPRAATLKALVLHTADEAGDASGPDYANGWGLLNTRAAADVIVAEVGDGAGTSEAVLDAGEVQTYDFAVTAGADVRVTIAWTDPPGTPSVEVIDPVALVLVNDLDLRLEHVSTGTIHLPWYLDRTNPLGVASRRDNRTDNVERIDADDLPGGHYRVTVTHKGAMTPGYQHYSLIWSGMVPADPTDVPVSGPHGSAHLAQNFPNPFNPATAIAFTMAEAGHARLRIFDAAGRLVATLVDEQRGVGEHRAVWDGNDAAGRPAPAGIYVYRLDTGGLSATKRMSLIK